MQASTRPAHLGPPSPFPVRRAPGIAALVGALAVLAGCASRPSVVVPVSLPATSAAEALGPAVACDPVKRDLLLSWIARDSTGWRVWFARRASHGGTWSAPVCVSPPGEPVRLEPEASPRIVCDDANRVGIAWSMWGDSATSSRLSDLRFAHSSDGGRTWGAPVTVNDDTTGGAGSQAFHDLALRSNGVLFAAWVDTRKGADSLATAFGEGTDASIWFARSEDFGEHWGPNAAHWSRACQNCRVSLVVDPGGSLFASFRKHFVGQIRDVVLARAGGPPVRLHDDHWRMSESPATSPAMALSRDGTLRLAWFTGAPERAGVWFRENVPELMDSTGRELHVLAGDHLPPVHPGIADAGMGGTLIACDTDSTGEDQLTLVRVEPSGRRVVERFVVPGTAGASYPVVVADRLSTTAYVAWTCRAGGRTELRLAHWEVGR